MLGPPSRLDGHSLSDCIDTPYLQAFCERVFNKHSLLPRPVFPSCQHPTRNFLTITLESSFELQASFQRLRLTDTPERDRAHKLVLQHDAYQKEHTLPTGSPRALNVNIQSLGDY